MKTDRHQHQLVADYLARLAAEATRRLPSDRAAELVEDIRAHLDEALTPEASEAEVRTVLDRVGTPSDLVDEAGGTTAAPPMPATPPSSNRLEVAALVSLIGSLVTFVVFPVAGLLLVAGMVLLLLSRRWTAADKVLGAIAYVALGAPALLGAGLAVASYSSAQSCSQEADSATGDVSEVVCTGGGSQTSPWLLGVIAVAWLAFQLYVAVRLARRARVASPA